MVQICLALTSQLELIVLQLRMRLRHESSRQTDRPHTRDERERGLKFDGFGTDARDFALSEDPD